MKWWPWGKRETVQQQAAAWIDSVEFREVNDGGFVNPSTGVGQEDQNTRFCPGFLAPEQELSDLVDTYWLARRIVRALPEAAYQERIEFAKAEDQAKWDEINRLPGNDDGAFLTAAIWARTHGASILILGQNWGGDPEQPLSDTAPIEWLEPVKSLDFYVGGGDLNEDRSDPRRFRTPEYYRIHGTHRFAGARIHHSRVIHFAGPTLSDIEHSRNERKMVQLSALDPVYDVIKQYSLSWSALSQMLQQGSIPIWTLKGLLQGIKQGAGELGKRMAMMNEQASVMKAVLLDADSNENYKREAVNFAEMPEIMKQLSLQVAAAGDIPVSELFGRIVSGLGDTGEVEDQKWIRRVEKYRTNSLAPRIAQIMPGAQYQWQPVKVPTQQQRAELFRSMWNMGQVTDAETRRFSEELLNLPPLDASGQRELEIRNGRTQSTERSGPAGEDLTGTGENPATDPDANPDS